MSGEYYKKIRKEMSLRFTLDREYSHTYGAYLYTILRDGVFFNPYGEGYKSVNFAFKERVPEDVAIAALKRTIECATREYIHNQWQTRDNIRKDVAFKSRVRNGISI